tara:strand:- start:1858 stop:1977 length:120 start_codon:yes stop_codon:yes gene_type:complete
MDLSSQRMHRIYSLRPWTYIVPEDPEELAYENKRRENDR